MTGRRSAGVLAVLVVLLVGPAGCTMCPDPFDYSGPVPNGSAPQNNFWARSNGIIPLGTVPRPWPRVVQSDEAAPPLAESDAGTQEPQASEGGEEELQPVSVLVGEPPADASAERTVVR